MNFFTILLLAIPAFMLALTVYFSTKKYSSTGSKKKAMAVNFTSFLVVVLMLAITCIPVLASEPAEAPQTTAAQTEQAETEETEGASASAQDTAAVNSSKGLGLLAAAGVMGLCAIGGGIAIAAAAPAAIGATSEDPKVFGKALIFVALGEAIALYGIVISILIITSLG